MKNKVCLLKSMISQFMVAVACCFCCFHQFLVLSFYSFHTCIMNYDTFLVFNFQNILIWLLINCKLGDSAKRKFLGK